MILQLLFLENFISFKNINKIKRLCTRFFKKIIIYYYEKNEII